MHRYDVFLFHWKFSAADFESGWRLPITLGQFCGVCLAEEKKKRAAEYYSSYKNAGLCRAGFGFPGHPVLNYSLKASAQLVEFVWIAWEAERVAAKTLELFVSLQFIQIKRPASRTEDISDYIFFPVLVHSQGVSWCLYRLSVCDILRLCFTYAISSPSDHHVHIGLWGPASRGGLNPSSGRSFTAH